MKLKNLFLFVLAVLFAACSEEISNSLNEIKPVDQPESVKLASYFLNDIKGIERNLLAAGIDLPFLRNKSPPVAMFLMTIWV